MGNTPKRKPKKEKTTPSKGQALLGQIGTLQQNLQQMRAMYDQATLEKQQAMDQIGKRDQLIGAFALFFGGIKMPSQFMERVAAGEVVGYELNIDEDNVLVEAVYDLEEDDA